MIAGKAAERYARALLELAREKSCIDDVHSDLSSIGSMTEKSADLARFLPDRLVGRTARIAVLKELFEKKVHPLTWRLILLLEGRKRQGLLPAICSVFPEVRKKDEGIVDVGIITSFPADEKFVAEVSEKIRRIAGKPTDISVVQRQELIAGMQFKIDDLLYDLSIKGLLDGLRRRLAGT